jgi:maleate cis-trans isomerase
MHCETVGFDLHVQIEGAKRSKDMSPTTRAKIGFIGSSAPSSPHHESFRAFIPKDIEFTFVQEASGTASGDDDPDKLDALVNQTAELVAQNKWNGVIISGAPKEVFNLTMWDRLTSAVKVPVATALRSSVAALKVFSAKQILLMTPVDDELKNRYRDFLAQFDIEAVYPPQTLRKRSDAQKLTPSDVEFMTKKTFAQYSGVDAIYFQGALLDPLQVLEKLEAELQVPIVASNPAMLWFMLSKLGLHYEISGYGRLLSSWPSLPA